mmetsp:Transcript_24195/g.54382  ORF Transcript_24195/g.54382 Transcript_24195/m.54382 type:complete len:389 (-) Transcript_24195:446-1612(-)
MRHGSVQQLRHDPLGQPLHRLPLLGAQPRQLPLVLEQLFAANLVGSALKFGDHRYSSKGLVPALKGFHLVLQQLLGLQHKPLPPRLVRRHHCLEVVHVVRPHALHLVRPDVVDVPRHADVHQHRVAPHRSLEVLLVQDRLHRPGACKRHVRAPDQLQHRVHQCRLDGRLGEHRRQVVRSLLRPVHDRDALHVARQQVLHQQPRHLPRSEDADVQLVHVQVQVLQAVLLHQLHRRRRDRHSSSRDPRLRPHPLPCRHRRVEHARQHLARRSLLLRRDLVAALHLREDLTLPDDERVQPSRHPQRVPHRVVLAEHEERVPQLLHRHSARGAQVLRHLPDPSMHVVGHKVDLEAVAGGEDRSLLERREGGDGAADALPVVLLHSQLLADLD